MTGEGGRYRDVTPTFWMAIGFGVLYVAMIALRHPVGDLRGVAWLWLVQLGVDVTMTALFAVATAELAQRHHGLLRLALKIAVIGWVALCAMRFLSIGLDLRADDAGDADLSAWCARVSWLMDALATIAPAFLALAVEARGRRGLAIGGAIISLVSLPWFPLWLLAGASYESRLIAVCVLYLARLAVLAAIAAALSTGAATPEPERAARGFRGAATALRLRAIATALGVVMSSVTSSQPTDGLVAMVKYSVVAAPAVNALAFGWFALAMLRAARSALDGLSSWRLAIAGALALWSGSIALTQAVYMRALVYQGHVDDAQIVDELTLAVPLAASCGAVLVVAAIVKFARRRGLEQPAHAAFGQEAMARQVGVVVGLLIGPVLQWVLPWLSQREAGGVLFMVALVGSLAGVVLIARLFRSTADLITRELALPAARIAAPGA